MHLSATLCLCEPCQITSENGILQQWFCCTRSALLGCYDSTTSCQTEEGCGLREGHQATNIAPPSLMVSSGWKNQARSTSSYGKKCPAPSLPENSASFLIHPNETACTYVMVNQLSRKEEKLCRAALNMTRVVYSIDQIRQLRQRHEQKASGPAHTAVHARLPCKAHMPLAPQPGRSHPSRKHRWPDIPDHVVCVLRQRGRHWRHKLVCDQGRSSLTECDPMMVTHLLALCMPSRTLEEPPHNTTFAGMCNVAVHDLKAAYDHVDREALWHHLQHVIGVPLQLLTVIQNIFLVTHTVWCMA
jgi:hypothetical protein